MLRRYSDVIPKRTTVLAAAAVVTLGILWPFMVPNFWVFLGAAACLFAIGALGLTVLVGWAGQVSLAQASLIGTAVYVSGYAVRADGWGWPMVPGVVAGTVVAVVLSCVVSLPTARMSGIYVMVLTLGVQVAIERTIFSYATLTGGTGAFYMNRPSFLGISFDSDKAYYYLTLGVLIAVLVGLTLFRASRHGRAMLLVKADRRAASAIGVSPWKYKVVAFALAGLLAGIAGGLTAPLYRSPPNPTQYIAIPSLLYLAVPVTAGFESLLAVVAVAFAFQMVPQAIETLHISMFLIGGIGLLAGTYVGPRGLGGAVLDLVERRRRATRRAAVSRAGPGRATARHGTERRAPVLDRPLPSLVVSRQAGAQSTASNGHKHAGPDGPIRLDRTVTVHPPVRNGDRGARSNPSPDAPVIQIPPRPGTGSPTGSPTERG